MVGQTLLRCLTKDDWKIFHKYALRVRHASLANSPHGKTFLIDHNLLACLASMDATQPLLPNVTSIDWRIADERNLYLLTRMMTKSLTSLVLDVWAMPLGLQRFISSIASTCPALQKLLIYPMNNRDQRHCDSVSQTVYGLHHLTTVHCGTLDARSLNHLSCLPSLVELKFALRPDVEFRGEPLFQNLQVLDIHAQEIMSTLDIMGRMRNRLTSLSISSGDNAAPTLAQLFRCLSNSVNHCSLRRLRIMDARLILHHVFTPSSALTLGDFYPLLLFKHLTHMHFDVGCGTSLDDVAALELAQAWPGLVQLVLNRDLQNPVPSSVTPIGLVSFLRHCPNLVELALEVDFSLIEEQDVYYHGWIGDISHQHLLTFHATFSRIHDAGKVAAFLSDILPRTARIQHGWIHGFSDQRDYAEKWHEASRLLHTGKK